MSERETSADGHRGQVRIRLPTGEDEWVTPEAFNLISEREFQDSHRLRILSWQRNAAVVAAAVLALLLGVALLTALSGRDKASSSGASPAAVTELPAPSAPAPPPAVPTQAVETRQAVASSDAASEIESTVRAWADAWSSRDVDRYLGFYSPAFQAPEGLSRAAWEALRRERITAPASISVTLSDVEAAVTGDRAVARFGQAYRAPGYRDWVAKTLLLSREADGWRIVDERSALIEAAPER